MAEMVREGTILEEDIQALQITDTSTSISQQGNEPEITRWKTAEIFKVRL